MKPLIIRADASTEIGSGHVMRCLALAETWQDCGGNVFFVLATASPSLEKGIKNEGFEVIHITSELGSTIDADATIQIARMDKAEWVVVDGYHFGAEYQKKIKECGFSLLYIDDFGQADHYYADIVLNQNIYADMSFYQKYEPSTRFLLGTKFVLLRREFLRWAGYKRTIPKMARKVLVTLGSSDPENVTSKVIEALRSINFEKLEVIIVAGGLNPNYAMLQDMVKDLPNFSLKKNVENMPELMAWADLAISAGGSTCWELAFMKLPFLSIVLAENQRPITTGLHTNGAAISLGDHRNLDPKVILKSTIDLLESKKIRSELIFNQKKMVDGKGAIRVVNTLL
jgi:UDP-2,4-diacetamido-2,4,6-trideoxy-beta-L-altropyranose hydrolase